MITIGAAIGGIGVLLFVIGMSLHLRNIMGMVDSFEMPSGSKLGLPFAFLIPGGALTAIGLVILIIGVVLLFV